MSDPTCLQSDDLLLLDRGYPISSLRNNSGHASIATTSGLPTLKLQMVQDGRVTPALLETYRLRQFLATASGNGPQPPPRLRTSDTVAAARRPATALASRCDCSTVRSASITVR